MTLADLWVGGQETTANTLYWAFSYITANPEVVEPLIEELDSVTQKTRSISLQDRPKTPYLNAVITFNPQRYLDTPELEQYVIPFSLGKRACLGESLARAELYLILGNLMSRFNFKASAGMPPSMEAKIGNGANRQAKDYKVVINKRNTK